MDRGYHWISIQCGQAKNATDVCIGTLLAMVKLVRNTVSVLRSLYGPPVKGDFGTNEAIFYWLLEMVIQVSSTSIPLCIVMYNVQPCTPHTVHRTYSVHVYYSHALNSQYNRAVLKGNISNPPGATSAELIVQSGGLEKRTGFAKLQCTGNWSHWLSVPRE